MDLFDMSNIVKIKKNLIAGYNRARLRNKDFSLITNTCIGGIISHELHLQFLSPIVNCGIVDHYEFLNFCEHLDYYLTLPLNFVESGRSYPMAVLHGEYGDVTVDFRHYHSQAEAKEKWEARIKRMRWDNLYVLMDGDNCSDDQVAAFDNLPEERKVIITRKEYPELKSVFAITRSDYVQGDILKYGLMKGSVRWFEVFDYVHFFNTGKIRGNALFRNR